jgi:hypothetical protein
VRKSPRNVLCDLTSFWEVIGCGPAAQADAANSNAATNPRQAVVTATLPWRGIGESTNKHSWQWAQASGRRPGRGIVRASDRER